MNHALLNLSCYVVGVFSISFVVTDSGITTGEITRAVCGRVFLPVDLCRHFGSDKYLHLPSTRIDANLGGEEWGGGVGPCGTFAFGIGFTGRIHRVIRRPNRSQLPRSILPTMHLYFME